MKILWGKGGINETKKNKMQRTKVHRLLKEEVRKTLKETAFMNPIPREYGQNKS